MKEIPLTKGKVALVDDEDYERLTRFKWHALKPSPTSDIHYAARSFRVKGKRYCELMHHAVNGRVRTDHRDGDGLNNQRHNLRPCSQMLNMGNRGGSKGRRYKGIWANSARPGTFSAQIQFEGKKRFLGASFASAEEAARAYDAIAAELFGEFARLNFPPMVT